jgi:hypothetical protein
MIDELLNNKIVNILGTDYKLVFVKSGIDEKLLSKEYDGLCDNDNKTIYINNNFLHDSSDTRFTNNPEAYMKRNIRHEIIHAFLHCSGLDNNCNKSEDSWATNEEMVDWFAIQSPKINKVFNELGIGE